MTETYYVLRSSRGRSPSVYHTGTECKNFPSNPKEITPKKADLMDLEVCSYCAGTNNRPGNDPLKYIRQIEEQVADD